MQKHGPVVAWIVDDTGFPKKGKHSVGVARQYCGQVGKQDNCRVAVSLSVSDLEFEFADRLSAVSAGGMGRGCRARAEKPGVPEEVEFQTKPEIALDQIRQAVAAAGPGGVVLADAGYGIDTQFRDGLTELGLQYVVGVQSLDRRSGSRATTFAGPAAKARSGRPPRRLQRDADHQPVSVKQLALQLALYGLEGHHLA